MVLKGSVQPLWGFPGGSAVDNPPATQERQEMQVWSLSQEDPPEEGIATHSSILAWKIPWTEKPGGLQSIGLKRVSHDWATPEHTAAVMSIRTLPGCPAGRPALLVMLAVSYSQVPANFLSGNAQLLQSCPILCDPLDRSPPGSSFHGILQARILAWVARPSSRGSSQPRNQTRGVSCIFFITGGFLTAELPGKPFLPGKSC